MSDEKKKTVTIIHLMTASEMMSEGFSETSEPRQWFTFSKFEYEKEDATKEEGEVTL